MQLFHLAKEQLKRVAGLVQTIQGGKPAGAVFTGLGIPLLQYTIGKEKPLEPGEEHKFQGIDVPMVPQQDGLINLEHVRGGVTDFVNSVLLFAHNPIRRVQHGKPEEPNVTIESDERKMDEYDLRFAKLGPDKYDARPVFQGIDDLEVAMFANWKPRAPKSPELIKTFPTADEAARVTHLLMCMGNAIGLKDEDISGAFRTAPNDHTLVVHEDYMRVLAHAEQSQVAEFGRRRA